MIKISEIKEAIDICKEKPENYDNYENSFNVDLEIAKLKQELEETKEKIKEKKKNLKRQMKKSKRKMN